MRTFFWPGQPRGQGRPRFNGRTAYKTSEDKAHEQSIRMAYWAKYTGEKPMGGALGVKLVAVYPIPQSRSKKDRQLMAERKIPPTCKPDLDNIFKAVLDALNGVAFEDDKQVVELSGEKVYGEVPGLMITIWDTLWEGD